MREEVNNISIGKYKVDLFISDTGNLGITVTDTTDKTESKCVDVFVNTDAPLVYGG